MNHEYPEISEEEMKKITPGKPEPVYKYHGMQTFDVDPYIVERDDAPVAQHDYPPVAAAEPPQQSPVRQKAQRSAPAPREAPSTPTYVLPPVSPPRSVQKVGVGLQLEKNETGDIEVAYVVPGFAAHASGLFSVFDKVLTINDTELRLLDLADVKKLTIGYEGTECSMVMSRHSGTGTYVARLTRQVPHTVDQSNAECTQAVFKFMSADTDGDGMISYNELRASLPSWSDTQTRSYFQKMDINGDGQISQEEYEAYWAQHTA